MRDGHRESEPAVRFVDVLDMCRAGRKQARKSHLDPPSIQSLSKIEVIAAADEMKNAALFEDIQGHAQARGQPFHEAAARVDDLRGTHETGLAIGPAVLPIPRNAALGWTDMNNRRDALAGSRYHGRAKQLTDNSHKLPQPACAYHVKLSDVVDCERRFRKTDADRFGKARPRRLAKHELQAVVSRRSRFAARRDAGNSGGDSVHGVALLADDLGDSMSEPHHLEERLARQRLDRVVPAGDGLQELKLAGQSITDLGGCLRIGLE
jgi:hypothetical protein